MSDERDDDEIPEEIVLPIERHLDLHAFRPRDVRSVVESYIDEAQRLGFSEIRLIHGRGIGVQREMVRSLLQRHPAVMAFDDAPPERGGWGATVVRLRRIDDVGRLDDNDPGQARSEEE